MIFFLLYYKVSRKEMKIRVFLYKFYAKVNEKFQPSKPKCSIARYIPLSEIEEV